MRKKISIIVPLFNEEECLELLYERIIESVSSLGLSYEILFVDDGSTDDTFNLASKIADKDKKTKVIKFRKNYGQTAAMTAGIEHASGDILITMDGDLQNDPDDIPKFIDKIEEGYDIVCGWRHKRQDKLISRKIPSIVANWIIGKITGVSIRDNGCSLKAYRANVIKSIPLYSDMHRFIPAMTTLAGTKISEIKVSHHPRLFGISKYGISRIYKVIIDLLIVKTILSFSSNPLNIFGSVALFSTLTGVGILFLSFLGLFSMNGNIDFMVASGALLFFILSCFLFLIGFLCELVVKTGHGSNFAGIKLMIE